MFRTNSRFDVRAGRVVSMGSKQVNLAAKFTRASAGGLAANYSNNIPSLNNISVSGNQNNDLYLDGLINATSESNLRRYYQDIYYNDTVAGSCVDLMSTIPFGDFSLTGVSDVRLDKYMESISRLNLTTLLPEVSREYLVNGAYVGTLVYDKQKKIFSDVINYTLNNCKFDPIPVYSADPIITVRNDKTIQDFINSSDPAVRAIRDTLPPEILEAFRMGSFTLDALSTIFLPRKTLLNTQFTSYYRRILPIYLLEKVLFRGTIVEANKRQRPMTHITVGDEDWEPTPDDLNDVGGLFQAGELDPLGAYVVTRNGVAAQQIGSAGDNYKITDIIDTTTPMKLRALGISEAFLSGDATYANAEMSVSVFMEGVIAYRELVEHRFLMNRIFPIIAAVNEFNIEDNNKRITQGSGSTIKYRSNDNSGLDLPQVRWHKQLTVDTNSSRLEALNMLSERGIPPPLRMLAAAGGLSIEELLHDMNEDAKIKAKIKEISGVDLDVDTEEASHLNNLIGGDKLSPVGIMNREFSPEASEVFEYSKTGQKKYVSNQKALNEKINANISSAVTNMADDNQRKRMINKVTSRLGKISSPYSS